MSSVTSGIILITSMVISVFLQLSSGIFLIFYHSALARTSRKKADDMSLYFILGVEFSTALVFFAVFLVVSLLLNYQLLPLDITRFVLAGIFGALSVSCFFFYFRRQKPKTTELFIPRKVARSLAVRAKSVKKRSDVFLLGFSAPVFELIFTVPLFFVLSLESLTSLPLASSAVLILYILFSIIPLFSIRNLYKIGRNTAEIERVRVKNVMLVRLVLTVCFLVMTISLNIDGVL